MSALSRPSLKLRIDERASASPQAAIGRLLKNMHQSVRYAMDEALRRQRVDLSFAHFVALYTLASEPGVAGAELARRGFVTPQTMNALLRRLEKEGAIERKPNPANQRADRWYVTKAGQASLSKARVVVEGVWSQLFEALSDREVRQLQKLLARCLAGFDRAVNESRGAKGMLAKRTRRTR
jgi:DNA-binding MarR family transcriptional regulator